MALPFLRRDDGPRAVAWPPRSWWGLFVSEGIFLLQLMRAGRTLRRARPRPINSTRGETTVFYLSIRHSCSLRLSLRVVLAIASFPLRSSSPPSCSSSLAPSSTRMAPQPPLVIIDPFAWERSTVTRLALNQLVTASQLAANEDGRPAGRVDRAAGWGPRAQPSEWLRG
jgi:hypothetical protein